MTNFEFERQVAEFIADISKCGDAGLVERAKALLGAALTIGRGVEATGSGQDMCTSNFTVTSMVNTDNDVKRLTGVSALAVGAMGLVAIVALLAHR